jgi:hypothetical protein
VSAVNSYLADEDVSLGDKEIAQAVDEAGRIVVKLRRGRFGGKLRQSSTPRPFDPLDDVDDTKNLQRSCLQTQCLSRDNVRVSQA